MALDSENDKIMYAFGAALASQTDQFKKVHGSTGSCWGKHAQKTKHETRAKCVPLRSCLYVCTTYW